MPGLLGSQPPSNVNSDKHVLLHKGVLDLDFFEPMK
jgi:hypothetical protein